MMRWTGNDGMSRLAALLCECRGRVNSRGRERGTRFGWTAPRPFEVGWHRARVTAHCSDMGTMNQDGLEMAAQ